MSIKYKIVIMDCTRISILVNISQYEYMRNFEQVIIKAYQLERKKASNVGGSQCLYVAPHLSVPAEPSRRGMPSSGDSTPRDKRPGTQCHTVETMEKEKDVQWNSQRMYSCIGAAVLLP